MSQTHASPMPGASRIRGAVGRRPRLMLPGLVIASAVPLVFACIEAEPAGPDGDQVPPVIGAGEPSGMLGAGTTQAMMRVTTSEAATCRWSLAASDAFANMPNVFTTTDGTAHATLLTSLADGQSYTRYVRCRDGAGNSSTTSHVVSFSVAMPADVTAPVISDPQPAGSLPAGTRQASLRVTTNEAATCRYGGADQAYAQLPTAFGTTGGTSHAAALAGLVDGQTYTYYVRCQDPAGNASGSSTTITFAVAPADVAAPSISNGQPSGTLPAGTTQATMSVVTNETAACRWGASSAASYSALPNVFTTTGGTSHATLLTGLANGQSYVRYVRCQDAAGNASAEHQVAFSVATPADLTPPVISGGQPTGTLAAGTTQATMSVATNENATCRWGVTSASYASLPNTFSTTGGISHATSLTGLANGQSYTFYIRCQDAAGNASPSSHVIAFSVAMPADLTPPVISNGLPTGTLAAGTTQATLSVATNEAATCRWGTSSTASYASLPNAFATTGGTSHSTPVAGLADGQSYAWYVRCADGAGNASASAYAIAFNIATPGDQAAPVISNGQPTGTLASGTTQVTMSVTTNEAATCRWGTQAGESYVQMTSTFASTGGTTHSTTIGGLSNGQSYTRYVRCQDATGNANASSYVISFAVASPPDLMPPAISGGQPTGTLAAGTTQTVISVVTNEPASCRWGLTATTAYGDLPNVFTTSNGTSHSTPLTGLSDGQSYMYYVRCQDAAGNASGSSYSIGFSVAAPADVMPPTISGGQPTGTLPAGTTSTVMSVVTSEAASCRWGTTSASYANLPQAFTTTGGTQHSTTLTGLANGQSYTFYIRCQDAAGNASTTSYTVSFSVAAPTDLTPPTISNGQPTGTLPAGTSSTSMSVTTNEAASCRWGPASAAYANLPNAFASTGGTSHATNLTGLVDGQSYTMYIRCQDAAGNANASSYTVTFSIATPADVTPPTISNGLPAGVLPAGTTQATMSVVTSETASCRWGTSPTATYATLPNAFATTGGTSHSTPLTSLADGQSYTFHVRCQDPAGNASAEHVISFSVAVPADVTPPVISDVLPTGTLPAGTTQAMMSVTTNENASCRWGAVSTTYANLPNAFTTTGGTTHSTALTGLSNGQTYTRYVRCQDTAGNASSSSTVVSFSVAAPVAGSVEISPASVVLDAGDTQGFTAVVRDTEGQVMSATVAWIATGGTITTSGSYTAGGTAGQFRVIASVGSVADTADVTIEAASTTGPVLSRVSGVFRLDGVPITRFGLRASNALQGDEITQRLIDALPDMRTHGMQSFSITIQGGRHEDNGNSAFNGFNSDGTLKPEIRARLTALLDASAERDMVPVIVLFYQGRDQELANETAVRNAVTQTMTFLQPWRHAWVNVINEPNHSGFDHSILSTSSGQAQLYQLAKGVDPQRIVYVSEASGANDGFISDTWGRAGIGTSMPAGSVCIEYDRFDEYSSPGIFTDGERNTTVNHAEAALGIPAYFFYHASWHQKADAAGWPRFDKGGTGTASDPGVSFIWNRMRELAGLP